MKILTLTSIRSEYDLMTPLLFLLRDDPAVDLKLLVGGAHNSPSFGLTREQIEADRFEVLLEIESLIDANSKSSRLKGASILLISSIDAVRTFNPDLIIYAGDREEVMIGALLGAYLGIPTLHLYGGDHASDGHVDNPIRHAVSKLSTCHFVSTAEHEARLRSMKEPQARIFKVGSIALDRFHSTLPTNDFPSRLTNTSGERKKALVIYHPIASEKAQPAQVLDTILNTLRMHGYHSFIGLPNTDPGNLEIRNRIHEHAKQSEYITVYGNLARDEFIRLFKSCDLIIGNSSAGLLESASIPIPCINVGERQKGRFCAKNVIFVEPDERAIDSALLHVASEDFQKIMSSISNPYGDGNSAQRAYELIKTIDFDSMVEKTEDPLNVK